MSMRRSACVPRHQWCNDEPHHGYHLQVLLLVLPGSAKATQVDAAGLSSLAVLRLMGLPALQVLVQGQAAASLKERSAAKKRALAAVASQVAEETSQDTSQNYILCMLADTQAKLRSHGGCLHACMSSSLRALGFCYLGQPVCKMCNFTCCSWETDLCRFDMTHPNADDMVKSPVGGAAVQPCWLVGWLATAA